MLNFLRRKPEPKVDLPVYQDWIGEANLRTAFTPDIAWLEQYEMQNVFVYGETQRGHRAAHLVNDNGAFYAAGFTNTPGFTLWKKKLGEASSAIAMPAPLPERDAALAFPPPAFPLGSRIKGELHTVRSSQMIELDKYHLNGYHYLRRRVYVAVPYSQVLWLKEPYYTNNKRETIYKTDTKVNLVKAWMYLGIPEYWDELLDGGYAYEPVSLQRTERSPWINSYYHFNKNAYDVESNSS